jgi:hypothetical protein
MAGRNFNKNEELFIRLVIFMYLNNPLSWFFINSDIELAITNNDWAEFVESEKYVCQQPYQDLQRIAKSFKNKNINFEGKSISVWEQINYIKEQGKIIARFSQDFIEQCSHA